MSAFFNDLFVLRNDADNIAKSAKSAMLAGGARDLLTKKGHGPCVSVEQAGYDSPFFHFLLSAATLVYSTS